MSWDDDLTPEQRTAASHAGQHACLLAGPGTGKTLSLTRRILYLVGEGGIEPEDILALTFTRAATAELRQRVQSELGHDAVPTISTLHSFALRTILQDPARTRLPQPLRVADDWEERHIVQEELRWILNLRRTREANDLLNRLSADWERLAADHSDWERVFPNPQFLGAWREHRAVYGYTLRAELVYQLKLALQEGQLQLPRAPAHLLVDEYQDLNACDLTVIRQIALGGAELYCAGDDDQSIYGFRYANPEGIRRFATEYSPSRTLGLRECRRCDQSILNYGLHVARQDPRRLEKSIHASRGAGSGEVRVLHFSNQQQEAAGIARLSEWLISRQTFAPDQILILLRSDYKGVFSEPIRSALQGRGIDVGIAADPLEPLDSEPGRHFLCVLRLLVNRGDHLAWRNLLAIRENDVGSTTLRGLYETARQRGITFTQALDLVRSNPSLVGARGRAVAADIEAVNMLLNGVQPMDSDDMLNFVRNLANGQIADTEQRNQIISVFERVLSTMEVTDLNGLLRALNVSLGAIEQERESGRLPIMTMHQAKGLSADAVIIIAAEDEYIPGRAQGEAIDDERRLLYVSLTRARHRLYVTHCHRRTGPQRHTGRTSGRLRRNLTSFLSGGPIPSQSGEVYLQALT